MLYLAKKYLIWVHYIIIWNFWDSNFILIHYKIIIVIFNCNLSLAFYIFKFHLFSSSKTLWSSKFLFYKKSLKFTEKNIKEVKLPQKKSMKMFESKVSYPIYICHAQVPTIYWYIDPIHKSSSFRISTVIFFFSFSLSLFLYNSCVLVSQSHKYLSILTINIYPHIHVNTCTQKSNQRTHVITSKKCHKCSITNVKS